MLSWRALVVGCGRYHLNEDLPQSCQDAKRVFQAFHSAVAEHDHGDHVLLLEPSAAVLKAAVEHLVAPPTDGVRMFLYFAGHCYERNGRNYLQPGTREHDDENDVCVQALLADLERNSLLFVVVHGCRRRDSVGMAPPPSPRPHFAKRNLKSDWAFLFSCLTGECTLDESTFAQEFCNLLQEPGLALETLVQRLKSRVQHHRIEAHVSLRRPTVIVQPDTPDDNSGPWNTTEADESIRSAGSPSASVVPKVHLPSRLSGKQLQGFKLMQTFHKNGQFNLVREALRRVHETSTHHDDRALAAILQTEEHHFNGSYDHSHKSLVLLGTSQPRS
ncbi:unnamed protein product [Symbiodinium natans]|uniref:Peptidase C14 caspase domain-containing protein n=1 Tax=Symbiodinium natans TaxID=878477 RepID=A0A812K668_9DINO|nr:unnamed protein product [Symbiodinium natans]